MNICHGQIKYSLNADKYNRNRNERKGGTAVSQPNIDYMMNMTKEFLSGEIDGIAYTLDFPYEMEKRYQKNASRR